MKAKWTYIGICMLLLLVGCGRQIPAIEPALLQSKPSILMISRPNLPDSVYAKIGQTLNLWRDEQQIAYEWIPGTHALQEEQIAKIQSGAHDYIIVIGSEPIKNILSLAASMPDKQWYFLEDTLSGKAPELSTSNIAWRYSPATLVQNDWDEWVRQQLVSGRMIEWVTTSEYPIPSDWAPSEEADRITLADAVGWFAQLQYQVRSHAPSWIVTYAPLETSALQRIKTLQVPVIPIAATTVELQWEPILKEIHNQITSKAFLPGLRPYTTVEVKITKPS